MTQCACAIVGDQAILDRCARDLPLHPTETTTTITGNLTVLQLVTQKLARS